MGTRSITKFYQIRYKEDGTKEKDFCGAFYRQFDGYLEGHGKELKELLKGKKIIDGIQDQTIKESFNGIGCMGAWLIGQLKGNEIGSVYMTNEEDSQSYDYTIFNSKDGDIMIMVESYDRVIYKGKIDDMPETEEEISEDILDDEETSEKRRKTQ